MTFFGSFNHHERERKTIVIKSYMDPSIHPELLVPVSVAP